MTRNPSLALVLSLSTLSLSTIAIGGCRQDGRGAALETCVPGETLIVGCAEACGIGMCTGDPVLRLCDGADGLNPCRSASDTSSFVEVDDSCGTLCPRTRITCPVSGSLAVVVRGLSDRFSCEWDVEHRGILPPGGRAPETIACAAGSPVQVGCSLGCGIGECSGGASIRVCDGASSTADCMSGTADVIRENSSSSSGCDTRCPEYVVTCPASGSLTIVPRSTGGTTADFVCEWDARPAPTRAAGTEVCSPGTRLSVGCAAGCGTGTCLGDGVLRVCDGNITPEACLALTDTSSTLGQTSRSSCDSECPELQVACPPSGAITVVSRSQYADEGFGCDWVVRAAGIGE